MMKLDSDHTSNDIPTYITPVFFNNTISTPQQSSPYNDSQPSQSLGIHQTICISASQDRE